MFPPHTSNPNLKLGLTAAVKTCHECVFYSHLCHAFFTDINIVNKLKLCV
jgi:hypothetical protein